MKGQEKLRIIGVQSGDF